MNNYVGIEPVSWQEYNIISLSLYPLQKLFMVSIWSYSKTFNINMFVIAKIQKTKLKNNHQSLDFINSEYS